MKEVILFPFKFLICIPIYIYKYCISPLLPHTCRYYPSCSNYFIQAVMEFGPIKGGYLGIKRILRCTPKNKRKGYDPVPINLKGGKKWMF